MFLINPLTVFTITWKVSEEEAAAVKLQSLHRGNMARREASEKRALEEAVAPSYWDSLRDAVVSPIMFGARATMSALTG